MAVADYLGVRGFLSARRYVADQFVLFSSRDSTGGGPYLVEGEYPLGMPALEQGMAAG